MSELCMAANVSRDKTVKCSGFLFSAVLIWSSSPSQIYTLLPQPLNQYSNLIKVAFIQIQTKFSQLDMHAWNITVTELTLSVIFVKNFTLPGVSSEGRNNFKQAYICFVSKIKNVFYLMMGNSGRLSKTVYFALFRSIW